MDYRPGMTLGSRKLIHNFVRSQYGTTSCGSPRPIKAHDRICHERLPATTATRIGLRERPRRQQRRRRMIQNAVCTCSTALSCWHCVRCSQRYVADPAARYSPCWTPFCELLLTQHYPEPVNLPSPRVFSSFCIAIIPVTPCH